MPDNPKILGLLDERDGHRAAFVWCAAWPTPGSTARTGSSPANAARFVHGRASDFARLVEVSALKVVPGGWEIPDWDEFQVSDEAAKSTPRQGPKGRCGAVVQSRTPFQHKANSEKVDDP